MYLCICVCSPSGHRTTYFVPVSSQHSTRQINRSEFVLGAIVPCEQHQTGTFPATSVVSRRLRERCVLAAPALRPVSDICPPISVSLQVMSGRIAEAQAAGQAGLTTPFGLDAIIERCAAAGPSPPGGTSNAAVNVAQEVVESLKSLLSALPLHHQ